jgi:hypothetical protein
LHHIPRSFWVSLTAYWLVAIDLTGQHTAVIHKLYKEFGPVVRIGPKEASFADIESVNEIYSRQTPS